MRYLKLVLAAFCVVGVLVPGAALASSEGYGYRVFGYFAPTNLQPGSTVALDLHVYSMGAAQPNPTVVTVVDRLPVGWTVGSGSSCKGEGTSIATCEIASESFPSGFQQGGAPA